MSRAQGQARSSAARDRLTIASIAVVGLAALGIGLWIAEIETRKSVEAQSLQTAIRITEAASDVFAFNGAGPPAQPQRELREAILSLLSRISDVERMVVIDRDRRVWLDSSDEKTGAFESDEDIDAVLERGQPLSSLHLAAGGSHVLGASANHQAIAEIYVPVRRSGQIVGAFEFYIDMTAHLTEAARIARSAYLAFSGAVGVGMVAIVTLVWRSLLSRRRDIQALDELRRRAVAISSELELANQHQARFNANAAHELRTPLAVLRARLDAMTPDADVLALRREVDAMIRQVSLLLELARTETGTSEPLRPIDLVPIARDMLAQLYPIFHKQGCHLTLSAPDHPVVVPGDATLIQSALRNLLENALRVSPKGASIEVAVEANPPLLSVGDCGPGLDPSDLAALSSPFRRGPDGGSAGLGLAIVAEAARHLGAKLDLARRQGGGAIFTLAFLRQQRREPPAQPSEA